MYNKFKVWFFHWRIGIYQSKHTPWIYDR